MKNPNSEIVVGLDIGTTKICVFVAKLNENKKLEIIGFGKAESHGVLRGEVFNIDKTCDAIKLATAQAQEQSGYQIQSVYVGFLYATPILGGYLADRYLGKRKAIAYGAFLMALGQFALFLFHHQTGLLIGLVLLALGNGFFKPNISALVGQLYPKGDRRIDSAYTIFYMGINVGGAIGPIICGLVGDTGHPEDFKWAFLAGGIAMVISVIVQYLYHRKYVVDPNQKVLGMTPENAPSSWLNPINMVMGLTALSALIS